MFLCFLPPGGLFKNVSHGCWSSFIHFCGIVSHSWGECAPMSRWMRKVLWPFTCFKVDSCYLKKTMNEVQIWLLWSELPVVLDHRKKLHLRMGLPCKGFHSWRTPVRKVCFQFLIISSINCMPCKGIHFKSNWSSPVFHLKIIRPFMLMLGFEILMSGSSGPKSVLSKLLWALCHVQLL